MKTVFKSVLCVLFSLCISISFFGCGEKSESSAAESQQTLGSSEQSASQTLSTQDEAQTSPAVNYGKLKRDADSVENSLDNIIVGNKFRGTVYFKLGNDFEYIGSNGFSDKDSRKNNSVNTAYYAGDVTKQLTAAAIMLLQEGGKLSTSDTVDKYYPDYKYGDKITIRHLLTMTAGLSDYTNKNNDTLQSSNYRYSELPYDISEKNSAKENHSVILNWILSQELQSEPGESFAFSNSAYYLLGDIIEQASSTDYEDYIYKNILKPLNMTNSGFEASDSLATGYQDVYDNEWLLYPGAAYSSCGLISDTNDILKWIEAITGDSLLSAQSREEMFTPYKSNYAYGVYIDEYGNFYHTGSIYRFNSMVYFSQDRNSIFLLFSNYTLSPADKITGDFRKTLLPYLS